MILTIFALCFAVAVYAVTIRNAPNGARTGAQLDADSTLSFPLDDGANDYYTTMANLLDWAELQDMTVTGTREFQAGAVVDGYFQLFDTPLTAAPGTPATGAIYCADNDNWDPGSVAGTVPYLVIYTGSAYRVWLDRDGNDYFNSIATWSYAHFAGANHPYSDTTTPHVLVTTETKGGIITNCGATEDRVYTLHAYDDGMNFMVQVCAAYQMDLEPPSGGVINLNGIDAAADEHIINAADTPYDTPLSCRSIEISDDTYKLMCNSSNTNWAEATP